MKPIIEAGAVGVAVVSAIALSDHPLQAVEMFTQQFVGKDHEMNEGLWEG